MVRRVAVVGAGVSGLASVKCCLDEGLEPTCFERSDGIGGVWRFTEIPEKGRTSVYRSVITNTSKEMTCFSDFPFPEDWPNYMHHSSLLQYLKDYAEQFHLLDHIHFQTTVCSIRKHPDFTATGQWLVCTETNGLLESAVFDAVMVCSGRYKDLNFPLGSFPGIENFKGRYMHSWEYRDPKGTEGKNVLVIGAGNTGGDVAVELSHTAAKVFLSTRTGTWVLSRISRAGWPFDMAFSTRLSGIIQKLLPAELILKRMLPRICNRWFNHENYGLVPSQRPWLSVIVNDELPSCILRGAVVVKPNVRRFTEAAAIFEDGTVEENIDLVVFATGYAASFPFLEESVHDVCKRSVSLYKQVFPPQLERPTLAFIGFIAVTGSILPAAELQARWVTRVFNGSNKLPTVKKMMRAVAKQEKELLKKEQWQGVGHSIEMAPESMSEEEPRQVRAVKPFLPAKRIPQMTPACSCQPLSTFRSKRLNRPSSPMPSHKTQPGLCATFSPFHFLFYFRNIPSDKARSGYVVYMDDIASCFGVKPNMTLLFLSDPKLALSVLFGPCTSYQYRLNGPGKWHKAREKILTQWDRVLKPLKTRVVDASPRHPKAPCWLKVLAWSVFLGTAMLIFKCPSASWLPRIK
ncbi:Dimethylaniline monooxygenase [N-oxide-forming] 2 [Varanus komodoensis]|nr:Dimethylaniline monooxygenase [N-oxide-forming] 2 [Varanus komodoensis]